MFRSGDDRLMPVTLTPAALADRLREADLDYPRAGATAGLLPPATITCAAPWRSAPAPRRSPLPQTPWPAGRCTPARVQPGPGAIRTGAEKELSGTVDQDL